MAQAGVPLQRGPGALGQAVTLHRQGQLDEAALIYSEILAAAPEQPDAANLLGLIRYQQGRNVEALQLIGTALQRAAQSADILNNFALVLNALGRHDEAQEQFEKALAIDRNHVNALNNRADALARSGRTEQALAAYQRLLQVQPGHLGALNESGGLSMRLGRPDAALACYDRAIEISPLPELYVNKGTALRALQRDEEALACFEKAAALKPDLAEARWNASLVRLRRGDFARGWKDYEWRWRKADWAGRQRHFPAPLWLGEQPIAGKTIVLHAEQGLGDTIQFVRYAALVAGRGATVILECPPQLKSLMHDVEGVARVVARGEPLPPLDFHCPLMSLPWAFKTELATVPANVPYLRPDVERTAELGERLPRNGRWRVGLCWAGSRAHLGDRDRSIALTALNSILDLPGLQFVSLQKEAGDIALLAQSPHVVDIAHELHDFADTAAVIANLDLVVSVDTSVAHLAGAMAVPVKLLLPFSPDFRWMLDRADSPWYPTMRLFRQSAIGAWPGAIASLRDELAELARRPRSAAPR